MRTAAIRSRSRSPATRTCSGRSRRAWGITGEALGLAADVAGSVEIDLPDLGPTRMEVVVKDVIYDGVLGAAFLTGRTLTLDLAAARLWAS
ncbi:MAG: hypothetical protein ACYTDY_04225 [Planctomycetota bacterium]